MPELPEVETVRRGLIPAMEGAAILRLEQRRADLRFAFPERFAERLEGQTIVSLDRRAKYLLAALDGGEVLVIHLGMSGRFTVKAPEAPSLGPIGDFVHRQDVAAAHDHVIFHVSGGVTVTYNDPRRFGFMVLVPQTELSDHALFRAIGVEPLGPALTAAYLAERAKGRQSDLKAFLLDQRHIAGLGNIYVAEALHRAQLSPRRKAARLARANGEPSQDAHRLVREIKAVLAAAIGAGGSTLRDYRQSDGALGYFQHAFAVYGRDGEKCRRDGCSGTIKRIVQAGRSTFYCPACQR